MSTIIHFNEIKKNNYSFSAKLYEKPEKKYEFSSKLSSFLISPLQKGVEVGSDAYISNKKYKFIRTADISNNSFLLNEKSSIGVSEIFFKDSNLKKKSNINS